MQLLRLNRHDKHVFLQWGLELSSVVLLSLCVALSLLVLKEFVHGFSPFSDHNLKES